MCNGCDATWTGLAMTHCAADGCHETFSTLRNFDAHLKSWGERTIHRDPTEVGLVKGQRGYWTLPKGDRP